ncbi:MAG TPA: cysteine desulfurase family protein [Candidatus Omnitrophota bacterium]|nr:cysteine desulfurase family protein [Candidatus Omnitrophota bacterium]
MPRIYLDHNASTPVRAEVLDAMLPYFREHYGNASSAHAFGQEAKGAIEEARAKVAALVNAAPAEIVFTSGGTESDNMGVFGAARALAGKGRHVVVSEIEHEAVRNAAGALEAEGFTVTRVPAMADGRVDPDAVAKALRPDTVLVSVMAANNETGVLQPVAAIGSLCAERGIAFHTDAVQAAGKIPVDARAWQATYLTIAAHKFYGPKGVGALYVKRGAKTAPLLFGGEHERGRRPGTENVPGIVGMGAAAELARAELDTAPPRMAALRDRLEQGILARVPQVVVHGAGAPRACNTSHLSFAGAEGEHLLLTLDQKGIACSSGSACKSGSSHPSGVLLSMGVPALVAQAAVRWSVGRATTEAEIDYVLETVPAVVQKLRAASPTFAA